MQAKMIPPRVRTIGKLLYGNLPPHCLVHDQSQFSTSADNPAEMDSYERRYFLFDTILIPRLLYVSLGMRLV